MMASKFEAEPRPCRSTGAVQGAKRQGMYYGKFLCAGHEWSVVLWDGDKTPTLHLSQEVEIVQTSWFASSAL